MSDRLPPSTVEHHARIGSTNERASQVWDTDICLITADSQTAGRGTRGRVFHSPPEVGLYLSYLHRALIPQERLLRITPLAAVAVRRALSDCGVAVGIKWVNDLYLNGKKICGILTTPRFTGTDCVGVIIGIGINLGAQTFPPELAPIATSVENETGIAPDREHLTARIVHHLTALLAAEDDRAGMTEYRAASILFGKTVTVRLPDGEFTATVTDIDSDGGLCVCRADGKTLVLRAGEVSLTMSP